MLSRIIYTTAIFKEPPVLQTARVSIDSSILTLVFSLPVNASGITGITLSSDGSPLSVISVNSDAIGTDTLLFNLNRTIASEEIITITIASVNDIVRVDGNVPFEGVDDFDVDLNEYSIEYDGQTVTYNNETITY